MFEICCLVVILAYVIGWGHVAFLNGFFWLLDHIEGIESSTWTMDTFMTSLFLPLAFVITAAEIYLLYGRG